MACTWRWGVLGRQEGRWSEINEKQSHQGREMKARSPGVKDVGDLADDKLQVRQNKKDGFKRWGLFRILSQSGSIATAIVFLSMYFQEKGNIHTKTCTSTFMVVLIVIVNNQMSFSGRMTKQMVAPPPTVQQDKGADCWDTQQLALISRELIAQSENAQSQKVTWCLIPSLSHSCNDKIIEMENGNNSGCQGWRWVWG